MWDYGSGSINNSGWYVANTNIAADFPGSLTLREMEADPKQAGADPDIVINPLNCQPAEPC